MGLRIDKVVPGNIVNHKHKLEDIEITSVGYTGADCTGASGDKNRELSVSGTPILVFVDTQFLHDTIHYTFATNTITFLIRIVDAMNIRVIT